MGYLNPVFLIPVIDGNIWLAQRNTPPRKGEWGAVGGKPDPSKPSHWNQPKYVDGWGGAKSASREDRDLIESGLETLQGAAIREFCEEIYSDKNFPRDLRPNDFTEITRLGYVSDSYMDGGERIDTNCHFLIANLHRKDFSPSKREIAGFKPLEDFDGAETIFPLTRIALAHLHYLGEFRMSTLPVCYRQLLPQIEPLLQEDFIKKGEERFTTMAGAAIYYPQLWTGKEPTEPPVLEVLARIRKKD